MHELLVRRLEHLHRFTPAEREALGALCAGRPRHVPARRHIVHEGDCAQAVPLLVKGWACTYRHLEDGRWQIFSFLLPGDVGCGETPTGRHVDYSLRTISESIVLDIPHARLEAALRLHPGVAAAFASFVSVQASTVRERVMSLGQRKAAESCAHLVCEMFWRLRAVGLTVGDTMEFPLTQEEVGSLIGVSTVHANRMLQDLRKARLIAQNGRRLRILDLEGLEAMALFSPDFLGLSRDGPAPSARRVPPPVRAPPPTPRREASVRRSPEIRTTMRKSLLLVGGAFALRLFASSAALAAQPDMGDYRLAAGDVLDFALAGMPDMARKAQVDLDGTVSLPLVGEVEANGLTLADVRAKVRALIAEKEVRVHSPGGSRTEGTEVVWPDQVSLAVSEYRPVYLNGDVAKPGSEPFRPGMDVRQALSLAGGYDILRFRMENPFLVASDLRGSYESAWIEFARDQAALSRIRAELDETRTATVDGRAVASDAAASSGAAASPADPAKTARLAKPADPAAVDLATSPPVAPGLLASIRANEAALKAARDTEFAEKRAHSATLLKEDADAFDVLVKRRDAESADSKYDKDEFERIEGVFRSGAMPMTRVADARRLMLLSSTQALQSAVEVERARTDREVHLREAEAIVVDRRVELAHAQVDAQLKLADDRVRIQALGDKLLYTGALKSQLVRGTGGRPDITLFRRGAAGRPVTEEEMLMPGDVLEVALHVEGVPQGASTLR